MWKKWEDKNHTLNKTAAENMNTIWKWALALLKTFQLQTQTPHIELGV